MPAPTDKYLVPLDTEWVQSSTVIWEPCAMPPSHKPASVLLTNATSFPRHVKTLEVRALTSKSIQVPFFAERERLWRENLEANGVWPTLPTDSGSESALVKYCHVRAGNFIAQEPLHLPSAERK
jgi:hypothetical protein